MLTSVELLERPLLEYNPSEAPNALVSALGNAAVHTRVVVGLRYPDSRVITARNYELQGVEYTEASIELTEDGAARLAIAYRAAMVEQPANTITQCDSFADFVEGWRGDPYHTYGKIFKRLRYPKYAQEPTRLDLLKNGTAYSFQDTLMSHVVLGIKDPTRNLSKFGDEPVLTMRNLDTAHYFGKNGMPAAPYALMNVEYLPRPQR